VATALAKGTTELHGWVYDIGAGEVEAWDEAEGKFITIDTRYAEQIRDLAGGHTCAA
jgi:carbonic anhydrase